MKRQQYESLFFGGSFFTIIFNPRLPNNFPISFPYNQFLSDSLASGLVISGIYLSGRWPTFRISLHRSLHTVYSVHDLRGWVSLLTGFYYVACSVGLVGVFDIVLLLGLNAGFAGFGSFWVCLDLTRGCRGNVYEI